MRSGDKSLNFFLNGDDQGKACEISNNTVYAVVDLYGQCAQVSLTSCGSPSTTLAAGGRASACVPIQGTIAESLVAYAQSDTLSSLQVASVIQPPNNFTPDHIHRYATSSTMTSQYYYAVLFLVFLNATEKAWFSPKATELRLADAIFNNVSFSALFL